MVVTYTASCPVCGKDAEWRGMPDLDKVGGLCGTRYLQITCPDCGPLLRSPAVVT